MQLSGQSRLESNGKVVALITVRAIDIKYTSNNLILSTEVPSKKEFGTKHECAHPCNTLEQTYCNYFNL
jgi:hypothetical protein